MLPLINLFHFKISPDSRQESPVSLAVSASQKVSLKGCHKSMSVKVELNFLLHVSMNTKSEQDHLRHASNQKLLMCTCNSFCFLRYELGATVSAINASLGRTEPVKDVMTNEAIAAYENKLIQQAQEESLRLHVSLKYLSRADLCCCLCGKSWHLQEHQVAK